VRDVEKYRSVYSQILRGYSSTEYKGKDLFVLHLSESDIGQISEKKNNFIQEAKNKGLPDEEEKLKILDEQEIWTNEEEQELEDIKEEVKNQEQSLKNLVIKSQKQTLNSKILINKRKLKEKLIERKGSLDLTCEEYGERKSQEEIVYYSLFKDKLFKERYLTRNEFEELPQVELHYLMQLSVDCMGDVTHDNIRRVCVLPFFLNSFFICNDDPMIFYGKPVVDLTVNQISLFSTGKYFKTMLSKSEAQPPETDNVDELVEWYESTLSKEDMAKKLEGKDSTTLVGATKEDMKSLVNQIGTTNLNKQVGEYREKTGKVGLDMDDMLNLHGYNIKDGRIKE
jgi:hypothetical protein